MGRLEAAKIFYALSRLEVKKLTLCSMSSRVYSRMLFYTSINYERDITQSIEYTMESHINLTLFDILCCILDYVFKYH